MAMSMIMSIVMMMMMATTAVADASAPWSVILPLLRARHDGQLIEVPQPGAIVDEDIPWALHVNKY